MEVSIDVDARRFEQYLDHTRQFPRSALDVGAEALYEYLIGYHSQIDWKESRWMPGAFSGQFQREVVQGWQKPSTAGNTVTIKNTFGLLTWKVRGGVITPRRATHLTIPLTPLARGRSASEFVSMTGNRLFRAGDALCRKIGREVEAVYALSLGVRQDPYPQAMPSKDWLNKIVVSAIKDIVKNP